MEDLGVNPDFWKSRRVLITGHTGFKGAWLSLWLTRMGARVSGYSLAPESDPNLWTLLDLKSVRSFEADICDAPALAACLNESKPEIVFHMAAQSLVRRSYREPVATFATNVQGTATVLDEMRKSASVQACVVVTSDKCYENIEQDRGYTEDDRMGGRDPYSASKGAAELVTASMRQSFFAPYAVDGHPARIASARAGNVIGGGDWSEDRLIPDIVRGCLGANERVLIRSPNSVRPWQHVLEPLRGYLMLAEALFAGGHDEGWNFGPDRSDERAVLDVAQKIVDALGKGRIDVSQAAEDLHEAKRLQLDSTKARGLGWAPVLDFEQTAKFTAQWYGDWAAGADPTELCLAQIEQFLALSGGQR